MSFRMTTTTTTCSITSTATGTTPVRSFMPG